MGDSIVDFVQHATRDPRFTPGARQAFFSTELGTRACRLLGSGLTPAIARSTNDPVAVVQAAGYWQFKYKSQCLCIFPNQRWAVEDLWDAADIHVEGRKFCEQMLTFISRDTLYAADRFAKDWAREHPEHVDFTGINIGNVYDCKDPLTALDKIFVFGELTSFPRVFLWHVAFILIASWNDSKMVNNTVSDAGQQKQHSVIAQRDGNEIKGLSSDTPTSGGKLAVPIVSSPDEVGRKANPALNMPDQPRLQPLSPRITPQIPQQSGDYQVHTRYSGTDRTLGPSMASPNTRVQTLKVPKGSRNMGSGIYHQPQGWVENEGRTGSGPYLRQDSSAIPSIQPTQYVPVQMAMGPQMTSPTMPGPAMNPYVLGPPMLPHTGYPVQSMEPTMAPRGHVSYQSGGTRGLQIPPAYPNQPQGPQPVLMGEMTNIHFPGHMGSQGIDPRAPMSRRFNNPNPNQLFDPYSGNNRKFSGGQGYNDIGKKGAPSNYITPQDRGRKMSTSSGRTAYSSLNYMPPTGLRYNDTSTRRRISEDDPNITGDSVSGCGHTWIGPHNTTVKELWIGDLPQDVSESELLQLFEQTVKVTPTAISLRSNTGRSPFHAFITFASCADAKTALTINQFNPKLRNGEVRPTVSVPRRFYQKESPPIAYSDYSHIGQTANSHTRSAAITSHGEKSTVTNADNGMATTSGVVLYSPQDARSGLLKKPAAGSDAVDCAEAGSPELEKPKRQQKSPAKKAKGKNKRESPTKKRRSVEDTPNANGKTGVDVLATAVTTGDQSSRVAQTDTRDSHSTEVDVDTISNPVQKIGRMKDEEQEAITQPLEQSIQLDNAQSKVNLTRSNSLPTNTEDDLDNKSNQTPQSDYTTKSAPEAGGQVEDHVSEDEAIQENSPHLVPELYPEAIRLEPQAEARDQAMAANHGVIAPPSQIFPDSVLHDSPLQTSPLQDSPKSQVAVEESNSGIAQESCSKAKQTALVFPNAEDNSKDSEPEQSCLQDTTAAADKSLTEASPAKQGVTMSAPVEVAPPETTKKGGVQQMQSLHPFATKNKSQAKKERETKRKQQKKEEADRMAKAKADKAASSKKAKSTMALQPKIETSMKPATSSMVADEHLDLDAASASTQKHASEETKKSKGKSKAKITNANMQDDKKIDEGEASAQLSAAASVKILAHKHGSSTVPGAQLDSEFHPSSPVSEFILTPENSMSSNTQPNQETNSPSDLSPTPATHEPECEPDSPAKSVTSGRVGPTSSKTQHGSFQPTAMNPRQSLSRQSSASTVIGNTIHESNDNPSTFADRFGTSSSLQDTGPGVTVTKADNAPTETPKKKKNKRRNKKKKTPAAGPSTDVQSHVDENTPRPAPDFVWGDLHNYDPFTSQMSHIDAIRNAVESDKTSYFAVTNARMEREKKEREKKEKEASDALLQLREGGSSD